MSPDQLTDTIKQKELLFVYFYTPDCVQCNKYEETFARAAAEAGLKWVKANVKYYPEFKDPYKIKSIPSLVAFKGGSEVSRLETDWDENKVNTFFQSIQ
ncbi:Thioredoxin-M [Mycobacterium tuberculosis]|nr:Thioredoxin-M [Mycobacterium tuberculosis]